MVPLVFGVALGFCAAAHAGSFQLNEASAKSLARANAGAASANKDASANFYNPALLTDVKKPAFLLGGTDYIIRGEFSKFSATDAAGRPLSGDNGGNMGDHNRLGSGQSPILAFAMPLSDKLALGIALETPFGLNTTFDGTSVLRYQAQYTSLSVFNVNPNVAYTVGEHFSVGVGLDIARGSAKLSNKIDYGAVCYAEQGPIVCNSIGLTPQSHDGFFRAEGTDTAYGWNAGIAWQYQGTTIGLAYRSRLFLDLSGSAIYKNVPAVFKPSGAFQNTGVRTQLTMPDSLDLSASQRLGSAWRISATVRYTRWSGFQDLTLRYDNPQQPPSSLVFDYRNTWFVALGADWKLTPHWTLHGGLAWDESPVREHYREPRLPDSDRRWLALGATWHINPENSLSLGYAHLFIGDHVPMNHTGASGSTVVGQWSENADIVSLQYQMRF
jgi:long-chain fatty acid transport protein